MKKFLKPSNSTLRLGTMFQISTEDVYIAGLMASIGCGEAEAYVAIIETEKIQSEDVLKMRASRYINDRKGIRDCAEFMRIGKIRSRAIDNGGKKKKSEEFDPTNKDSIIKILAEQIHNSISPKEKADIAMKIADLQRMKQDENKDETELVHFYLPITCKRCSLYEKAKGEKEDK